jgi:hypothetical protein
MYRIATISDLQELKSRFPDYRYPQPFDYSLKQLGTLFVLSEIDRLFSGRADILEVGAGRNTFFDRLLGTKYHYSLLDKPAHFPTEQFAKATHNRKHATQYDGYLGEYCKAIRDASFDCIFSISVLEHVPVECIRAVCDDMYRMTRKGGHVVHSIDLLGMGRLCQIGLVFLEVLKEVGFKIDGTASIPEVLPENTLYEPLEIVEKYYFKKPVAIKEHAFSILVSLEK